MQSFRYTGHGVELLMSGLLASSALEPARKLGSRRKPGHARKVPVSFHPKTRIQDKIR